MLIGPQGILGATSRLVAEKTAITDGAIQIADQIYGSLAISAGSLNVGDCFRILITLGRDNNVDAYGTSTVFRMGTLGTTGDTNVGSTNFAATFPAVSGNLALGFDVWYRVVSIGANSVIEKLGTTALGASWAGWGTSAPMAAQSTLTGYNFLTQSGFFTISTTMATAVSTKPRTGHMRLEAGV